jgi:hypothetical protein
MSSTFHKAEMNLSRTAQIEDAFIFNGRHSSSTEFTIRFESKIEDTEGTTHFNTSDLVFSKAQAAQMLRALATMMAQPDPEQGEITWVISDTEYRELTNA